MIQSIVIVGAGLAGATAARALRSRGYTGRIHLIGNESLLPYDRPSLSKDVLGSKQSTPPLLMDAAWYDAERIDLHLDDPVVAIGIQDRNVKLQSGSNVSFDRLLFATGMQARRLTMPGANLEGVFTLRGLTDCESLRHAFVPGKSLVVIGGGLIGCEVATTARMAGLEVTILECSDELLTRVLGRQVGAWCREQLEAMGIRVELNARISHMNGEQHVRSVVYCDGREFAADLVLASIGGEPADTLMREAGVMCDKGVVVDACGQTSHPDIYAAGDVAAWPLKHGGQRSLETYINAQQQAEAVAAAMLGERNPAPQVPTSWTEIAGNRIQLIGDIQGPGEYVLRGELQPGRSAVLFRVLDGKVLAALAVNAPKDFGGVSRLVLAGTAVAPAALADTSISIRELLKGQVRTTAAG
ncbi:MAG: 3-phenylpropionate/trans-cinnamate dioxygenase ferredoxin reductase component [Azoarcus sp.]|uniref:NAD(P)/FAD-dependent oxidoreductase n=1 Tax=Cupriavidus pauculus TaxID=82633 RepID=UPI000784FA69|nr:FAD-dependent oxidoreductase [Cupriavidus pauculus]MCK9986174.1 3-phenylpropionate/trans-cinnamate dioxygenase ferredoxin reductase component [Azoarcus sp.]